ncbi:MAG: DUF1552 domain-containing protein [Verrucomicrobiota bacterium]
MTPPTHRRNFLRGLGATLALPWMESLAPRGAMAAAAKLDRPPVRTAFLFFPNGVVPENWKPKGDGEDYEFTPMLKSLAPHKAEFNLIENLWHSETVGRNGHWAKVPAWLAGGYVERGSGADLDTGGTSIDQRIAREIGHASILPSLELGVDEPYSGIDNVGGGFPRILGSHIAWRDPHTPVPKEIIPRLAFDRLFRTGSAFPVVSGLNPRSEQVAQALQRDDASVIDIVLNDAKSLQRRVSSYDRTKLDEYLDSVRAVERRLEAGFVPPKRWINEKPFDLKRPAPGVPRSHKEHVRLMLDIMMLAFWTDTTRVGTFMFGNAQTGRSFDFINGVPNRGYHSLSHHREDKEQRDQYEKIGTWHVEQFAYLLGRMKNLDEGGSSLLDNSQILFGTSLKCGNRHDPHDLPLIVAGKAGGLMRPGRRVRALEDTPMNNLLVAMAQNAGTKIESVSDSTGRMTGLG